MIYCIRGRIDPRNTIEAREKAKSGDYDPPEGIEVICEFEEPDGSYVEIVEAEDERKVMEYMDQSRFLFREYQYKEVKECSRSGRDAESCYLIEYKGIDSISRTFENVLLAVSMDSNERILIVGEEDHRKLFRGVTGLLRNSTEIRVAPVMGVEKLWNQKIEST